MNIKVICQPGSSGGYEASSVVFPKCIGRGETRGEALISLKEAIEDYIEKTEEGIDKNAEVMVL